MELLYKLKININTNEIIIYLYLYLYLNLYIQINICTYCMHIYIYVQYNFESIQSIQFHPIDPIQRTVLRFGQFNSTRSQSGAAISYHLANCAELHVLRRCR